MSDNNENKIEDFKKIKIMVGAKAYSMIKESGLVSDKFNVKDWKEKFETPFVQMIYTDLGIPDAPLEVCCFDGLFASFAESLQIAGMSQQALEKVEKELEEINKKDEENIKKWKDLQNKINEAGTSLSAISSNNPGGLSNEEIEIIKKDPQKALKALEEMMKAVGLPIPSADNLKPPKAQ